MIDSGCKLKPIEEYALDLDYARRRIAELESDKFAMLDKAIDYVNGSTFERMCLDCVGKVFSELRQFKLSEMAAQRQKEGK
jgi:hypothetical protein